jgi:AcrR family transcriptional regulator
MTTEKTIRKDPGRTGEEESPTKAAILDTTEDLIAENGVRAVSIRDISRAARVNLAAINYHFGSKAGLLRAVLERRISGVFDRRMAALDAVERTGREVTAEVLMEAFFSPWITCAAKAKRRWEIIARMMSRFFFEEEALVGAVAKTRVEPFRVRFTALLKKAVPAVPDDELAWRASLAMGVLHHHLVVASIKRHVGGRRARSRMGRRWLLAFCSAGLCAPASAASPAPWKGPGRKKQ